MKTRVLLACFTLLVLATPLHAQRTWKGEVQGRGGTQPLTLVLEVDGSELTGTIEQGPQPSTEIKIKRELHLVQPSTTASVSCCFRTRPNRPSRSI